MFNLCTVSGIIATGFFMGLFGKLELARNGQTPYGIVQGANPTPAEQFAAEDLGAYLQKITGARFAVVSETNAVLPARAIYVGWTDYARHHGNDGQALGAEEWVIKSFGKNLVLTGGRSRGTLYATYHFLEDELGVHWWNPWEETVPSRPALKLGALDRQGRPTFRYRDIFRLYDEDGGRFAARNRLNRNGYNAIASEYGGGMDYGPPYHVHTFFRYFPPKDYFAVHPEWFSLINGKRLGERTQLCLTNPDLRQAFLAKLRNYIATSWAEAKAANRPPPIVFDVSQNDWQNPCQCEKCQAIVKAEGSESGPIVEFVNFMADGIKDQYPAVFIDTLAYSYARKPPKTMKYRDNVIVRLADSFSDMLKPITAPENKAFREELLAWANVSRNLCIWDYAITYSQPSGMPLPTAHTYGPDYRFYAAHNVDGVFTELEDPVKADLRDFKVWMMMKTLENADADYDQLTDTFMDGYYGPAGKTVKAYLRALEEEARVKQSSSTCWNGSPFRLTYLNLAFVTRAQKLFDDAEQAVKTDTGLLRRVRFARLPLDRATLALYPRLMSAWLAEHGGPDGFPFDREAIGARALATWCAQIDQRMSATQRVGEKLAAKDAKDEIELFAMVPATVNLPEKFRDLPRGTVYDATALMTCRHGDFVKLVKDPEAETGIANCLDMADADVKNPEKYVLPMPWGLYNNSAKETVRGVPIKVEDIAGPGYHWYKMGVFSMKPGDCLYFFWSWLIQFDLDNINVCDPANPNQKFEVWARIKFEGPRFPHAKAGGKDAISVERIVLVKTK